MSGVAARAGAIVAFWDAGELTLGRVLSDAPEKLSIVNERGQERRVAPTRIVGEVVGPSGVARAGDDAALCETARRVREVATTIDVAALWEILSELGPTEIHPVRGLADLAVGRSDGEAQTALILALQSDGLRFVRRPEGWLSRSPEQVSDLIAERQTAARRAQEAEAFFSALASVGRGEAWSPSGSAVERRHLEALESLAVHEDLVPDLDREPARAALQASGIAYDRVPEGAFRLLRRLGVFSDDDENLQVRRFGLRIRFPDEVQAEASRAVSRGFASTGRRDLTGVTAVSIDGPRTREIDDLLSVQILDEGAWLVGVHIADPAEFVRPGDCVDVEAAARGVTHYMPDLKLPMLPTSISEAAASLQAGQERPALSFLVTVDASGEPREFEIVPSIVRSRERLDYGEVDRRLAQATGAHLDELRALDGFARARLAARLARGAVQLDLPDVDLVVAADGSIEIERLEADSAARLLVSEAMIVAGEVAARAAREAGLPVIYRRQAAPDSTAQRGIRLSDPIAARRVLRGMRRAESGLEPGAHGSLGLPAYTQVTSPLRRYQDLVTHRQLLAWIRGQTPPYDAEAMQRIVGTTESAEADSRRAERVADEYWKLRWLEQRVGDVLQALVLETDPRPTVLLREVAREQPLPGLGGYEPGQLIAVRIEAVKPRAGILVLRIQR